MGIRSAGELWISYSEDKCGLYSHVGAMCEYTMGAMLLDLEDPRKVIGKLKRPLLYPNGEERNGYVPNVVYSCGQGHQHHLIIPYGFSDHELTYATVPIQELLTELLAG